MYVAIQIAYAILFRTQSFESQAGILAVGELGTK